VVNYLRIWTKYKYLHLKLSGRLNEADWDREHSDFVRIAELAVKDRPYSKPMIGRTSILRSKFSKSLFKLQSAALNPWTFRDWPFPWWGAHAPRSRPRPAWRSVASGAPTAACACTRRRPPGPARSWAPGPTSLLWVNYRNSRVLSDLIISTELGSRSEIPVMSTKCTTRE